MLFSGIIQPTMKRWDQSTTPLSVAKDSILKLKVGCFDLSRGEDRPQVPAVELAPLTRRNGKLSCHSSRRGVMMIHK